MIGLSGSWPLTDSRLCPADGPAGCGPGGELLKAVVSLPMLCAHVRREVLPLTQLGVAWGLLRGELKKPVRVALIRLRNGNATKEGHHWEFDKSGT